MRLTNSEAQKERRGDSRRHERSGLPGSRPYTQRRGGTGGGGGGASETSYADRGNSCI